MALASLTRLDKAGCFDSGNPSHPGSPGSLARLGKAGEGIANQELPINRVAGKSMGRNHRSEPLASNRGLLPAHISVFLCAPLPLSKHNDVHCQAWKHVAGDCEPRYVDIVDKVLRNERHPISLVQNYSKPVIPQLFLQNARRIGSYMSAARVVVVEPYGLNA